MNFEMKWVGDPQDQLAHGVWRFGAEHFGGKGQFENPR
jgi:hypothetical protein